ncbi:hypothetical protein [Streptomyces sp. 35G-GA-8]|uniref:competence protein CoiA family protein n=1 Tax=Streptomyces sp. 35G-GA-8 TaxID=2939434 RepID=UPI00201F777C|nr:hypothetical protein [Streptomyces sp. 35G-GA-8]MCL7380336.1 hypothetical protein [Streptomyces sp. 35G-GA-8]
MANGVWHTGYEIVVHLTHADLGHEDRPGLLEEITRPVGERDRQLLECLEHHEDGVCQAEGEGRTPWMSIRQRTVDGITTLVAAHLPLRTSATSEESDKHKAMKERIARTAQEHGLEAEVEVRAGDGRIRTDVLVAGPAGMVGWEAQYSPITAATVRNRSRRAVEHGITPLWVTSDGSSALIDRTPWVLVDDQPWQVIAGRKSILVSAGARHLQEWRCDEHRQRPCPGTGGMRACGGFHVHWDLPALCLPPKPTPKLDELVLTSATGSWVPMRIPDPGDTRLTARMWVPEQDRARWREIVGAPEPELDEEDRAVDGRLTFTRDELDTRCRYGERTHVFDDARRYRATPAAAALHTWDEVPQRLYRIPHKEQRIILDDAGRQHAARHLRCMPWHIGPCAGCGTPIDRYGPYPSHACSTCRGKVRVAAGSRST